MRVHIRADDDPLAANEHDLHPARWARRCNWRSRTSRVCDRHRQELDRLLPTDCVGSSLLTPPGEQQIGVDAIALRHLRHGPARREALGDDPTLLPRRPKTTLTHPRVYSLIRLIMLHR
jgi:hypothetical protein